MKNARRKLEIPMSAAMPCKTSLYHACIAEAGESMSIRKEGAPHRYHEDHIAGKSTNSLSHYNLVYNFMPLLQAMKIPDAKAAVEKMAKTGENTVMVADES